ncbi:lITAF domain-containing protein isoform X1 [Danio rerio]|uniref:LITAF domain-containing protein isoform X1 n=3 Tax=Danio rerio TaxID=7955 RepID=E7FAA1_DANRE|nr:Lipopolysaccharide-induced tumor necrosis factor-alpha factor homolog-like [Danio rerio]XP_005164005.1 lipopolysaccharide-induced tumor necrosis factor-alpha factor-like isoform X1 [Danio rerio]|eukprot:NP_001157840.1 lipopolysaccharide-induced tumor necrosis factor-alpha factor-like [Danio rerio]
MSADGTGTPPPYTIPVEDGKGSNVKVYHVHTPFTPQSSTYGASHAQVASSRPVQSQSTEARNKYVSYESYELGRKPAMATCTSCQQQVLTNVTYKVGVYAWLMCILIFFCGFVLGCCLIPFFMKFFKDAYHSCPRCNKILHVEKKRCCH